MSKVEFRDGGCSIPMGDKSKMMPVVIMNYAEGVCHQLYFNMTVAEAKLRFIRQMEGRCALEIATEGWCASIWKGYIENDELLIAGSLAQQINLLTRISNSGC